MAHQKLCKQCRVNNVMIYTCKSEDTKTIPVISDSIVEANKHVQWPSIYSRGNRTAVRTMDAQDTNTCCMSH